LRTGEINSLGNVGLFTKEIVASYIEIKQEMKSKNFDERIKMLINKLRTILVSYIDNPPSRLNYLGVNLRALDIARRERNSSRVPSSVLAKPTRKSTFMTMGNLIARNARNTRNTRNAEKTALVSAVQARARGGKTRKTGRKTGRKTRKAGRKN